MPLTRRYEAAWLTPNGLIENSTRLAPATPLFEEAFSALARGAVIATEEGPVAVEDLVPGMRALTAEGRVETITWIGSMMLYPGAGAEEGEAVSLTRITSDALGVGRPSPDLLLGARARICLRDARLRRATGLEAAYVPARAFIDGVSVIEVTPVAPVTVYHVVLARQGSLRVAGLEVEWARGDGRAADAQPLRRALPPDREPARLWPAAAPSAHPVRGGKPLGLSAKAKAPPFGGALSLRLPSPRARR